VQACMQMHETDHAIDRIEEKCMGSEGGVNV